MRMLHNPIRRIDPDGKDWKDKVAGVTIVVITNVVPFSGSLLDQYTPNDRADYNNMLAAVDCSSIALGGTMTAGGTAVATAGTSTGLSLSLPTGGAFVFAGGGVAVGGFAVAAEGTIIMINSLMNKSEGYDRGGKKDDGNKKSNNSSSNSSKQPQFKKPKSGSGKEKATDVPDYAKGQRPYVGESGKDYATCIMKENFGENAKIDKGPGSDFNKIRKHGDRGFE